MGWHGTLLVYSLIGVAIGVAVALRDHSQASASALVRGVVAALFWPFFLPLLLGANSDRGDGGNEARPGVSSDDAVGTELLAAFDALDEGARALVPPRHQLKALIDAVVSMDQRLAELARCLDSPVLDRRKIESALAGQDPEVGASETVAFIKARRVNADRLRSIHHRMFNEREGVVAQVQEVTSRLILLRYINHLDAQAQSATELAALVDSATSAALDVCGISP